MQIRNTVVLTFGMCQAFAAAWASAAPADYFAIHIVDDQSGRGVPLVRSQTTNKVRYYTDSNGYVAFSEPGLMDQDIYFDIPSWGYEAPDAGFGNRGKVLHTTASKEAEVKIHRKNIAERLYRLTGEGIYRDTILLGKQPPIAQGLLNAKVMGQDTVETATYPKDSRLGPQSRPSKAMSDGREYYYFPCPFAVRRVLADYAHVTDLATYEGFTCLAPGSEFSKAPSQVARDAKDHLKWEWRKGAQPIGPDQFAGSCRTGKAAGIAICDQGCRNRKIDQCGPGQQSRADAAIRLQPDHVSDRPGGSPPGVARSTGGTDRHATGADGQALGAVCSL